MSIYPDSFLSEANLQPKNTFKDNSADESDFIYENVMEIYLLKSFIPIRYAHTRLSQSPGPCATLDRKIARLSGYPLQCLVRCLECSGENVFTDKGVVKVGVKMAPSAEVDRCSNRLEVSKAEGGGVRHRAVYTHPELGVVFDNEVTVDEAWKFEETQKNIVDYLKFRKVKLHVKEKIRWAGAATLPFSITKSFSDSMMEFDDCRGKVVTLGRIGLHKGGDYSFGLSESREQLFATMLCACFLRQRRPDPDPEVVKERKQRRSEAILRHKISRAKDPSYKAPKAPSTRKPKEKEVTDHVLGFQLMMGKWGW